jgi:beta-glucosidase-like glycosyl hydrolase
VGLLRTTLGFSGVSITDSLSGTASARGVSATSLAVKAASAGTDMILLTGSEASSAKTYTSLVAAASAGTIPLATLQASYTRIVALKHALPATPVDTTDPSVKAPVSVLSAGTTLGSTTVPVRTAWSASDPCGIARYGLARQTNGGAWATQALSTTRTHAVRQSLAAGSTYRYRSAATDSAGNASSWHNGATVEPLIRQEAGGVVAFAGAWRSARSTLYSGGTAAYASSARASATYRFTGTSVAWVTGFGPTRGSAEVWVDGVKRTTVSTHATTTSLRRLAFATSWPSQGTHTIRIVVVGTAGHPRVDVDAFVRLYEP